LAPPSVDLSVMDLKVENKPDQDTEGNQPAQPRRAGPISIWIRGMISEFRRFYYSITKDAIISYLKTFAWAAPLTVLIWVYAESEEQVRDEGQPINIEIVTNNPNKIAIVDRDENVIICDLEGPQANIDRFKATLSTGAPIPIEIDADQKNGQERIPILDSLQKSPRFKEAGITVVKCNPVVLTATVDDLVRDRQVPVRPPGDIPNLQTVSFDPPTIKVSGPKSVVDHLGQVIADMASMKELYLPGTHTLDDIALISDPSQHLTYDLNQVKVTITVAETDVRGTISVPIWQAYAPNINQQYSISLNGRTFTPKFDVIGPPDQIEKLKNGEVTPQPHALLEISSENVNDTNPVPVEIENLPDGVRVAGSPPEVSFTATRIGQ
jgi:hypothetical protein